MKSLFAFCIKDNPADACCRGTIMYAEKGLATDDRGGIYANLKMQRTLLICYSQKKSNRQDLLITFAASQPSHSPAPPHGPQP